MKYTLELENLSKQFGSFQAVSNVTLQIPEGSIFAFLGTNGAGKTTTIRMITGILTPSAGSVRVCGYNVQHNPIEAKSQMGVIPDRPYLYGKLTGREFLHFMADLYKVPGRLASDRIDQLIATFGLEKFQHELIDGYSHGMKQRLMMCAAQVHQPKVLIVDEPMVGLDPRGAKLLKDTFRENARNGMTIFMSTHSLSVAEEIADGLAIIKNGSIVAQGTLEQLYAKARSDALDLENVFLQIIAESEEEQLLGERLGH